MLELIILTPLLIVIASSLLARYAIRRRRFTLQQRILTGFFVFSALLLPLLIGVWIPDMVRGDQTVASSTTADGSNLSVHQRWGSDFYQTTLHRTRPGGDTQVEILDCDDSKLWDATIVPDESTKIATIYYGRGRSKDASW
jgi:hypothetical protein